MDILRRIGTEPQSAPADLQHTSTFIQQTPIPSKYAARTRDPNAPEYKYQVNQKCIYERRLPGDSYITAHLQRLQSGYYDTPLIHEDLIDNVRFVAINFVFHPSRSTYRFKSAEIRVALHNIWTDDSHPLKNAADLLTGQVRDDRRHSHATQTSDERVNGPVVKYGNTPIPPKPTRPKFLRHAPHLLYGSVSPETLDWNFNVAGSVGISEGPASASIEPSYGKSGRYKVYEMMKIQGSVRTLRSWYGHQYDIEDGELVWTLEENGLQKSGLPREFTFVMLLTKGSSNIDQSNVGDLTLDIDIRPKVAGFFGVGSFPEFVMDLPRYRPYQYPPVNLDQEMGQVFEPSKEGRGFNFARLTSQFDDFVFLPGTTHCKNDAFMNAASGQGQDKSQSQGQQALQASPKKQQQSSQQADDQQALPSTDGNTLNLRVFLENARGSPALLGAPISYLHLRPPSRNPSPLPPASVSGSQRSHKRTITITSQQPPPAQPRNTSGSSAAARPRSYYDGQGQNRYDKPRRRQQSLRKTRSRSELNSEYNSSPVQEKSQLSNDLRSSPVAEQSELIHDFVTTNHTPSQPDPPHETLAQFRAAIDEEGPIPQPDSQTLPQNEFHPRIQSGAQQQYETPAALNAELDKEGPILEPPQPQSGTEGTTEWRTPPETKAELEPSPRIREKGSHIRSRPTSNTYSDQPDNLRATNWDTDDKGSRFRSRTTSNASSNQPENLRTTNWESDDSLVGSKAQQQPTAYQDHGSQFDPTAEDTSQANATSQSESPIPKSTYYSERTEPSGPSRYAKNTQDLTVAEPEMEQKQAARTNPLLPQGMEPSTSRPFSYAAVREALDLAMAEANAGLAPGSTPSSGFGGTAPIRKSATVAAPPVPTTASARGPSITALPTIPATPPLKVHKREVSTSSSMGEATGVWNDSPPDWTSPALIAQPRNVDIGIGRSYSQRIASAEGGSGTSSREGSVRRKGTGKGGKTRVIRYSYPAAEQAHRYYRERTGDSGSGAEGGSGGAGAGAGGGLQYGDEARQNRFEEEKEKEEEEQDAADNVSTGGGATYMVF